MIAGETQNLLNNTEPYDNFLFFGKKKRKSKKDLTPEEKEARKQKRRKFWSAVGEQFQSGGAVSSIADMFAKAEPEAVPSDYDINIGSEKEEPPPEDKKGIPTAVWVIGGIVIVSISIYGYTRYQKQLKVNNVPI